MPSLTRVTGHGGSLSDGACLERFAAPDTRETGAAVDGVFVEASGVSRGVEVVADGGAAGADGGVEDASEFVGEAAGFIVGEFGGGSEGADASGEERFVGVDVADAGDGGLVEEGGLDRSGRAELGGGGAGRASRGEGGGELVGGDVEGVGAEAVEVVFEDMVPGGAEPDAAEASGVSEDEAEWAGG